MKKTILALTFLFLSSVAPAAEQDWKEFRSTHFIVYYKNAPEDFIRSASDKCENYYDSIASELGFNRFNFWLWDNRAKIYIYDDKESYHSQTGQPSWSIGCAQANLKSIKTYKDAQGFFDDTLPHEMAHIIFKEMVGFDNPAIPAWLNEGVAQYQEKTKFASVVYYLKGKQREGKLIPIYNLADGWSLHSLDDNAVHLFYNEAFSIVDYLIKDFGKENFVLFCQRLRDTKDLNKSLASTYSFNNVKELDEAWQKHILNE